MLITLKDVHEDTDVKIMEFLYDLLREREPHQAISHREMPTWDQHRSFVMSEPYKHWWIITSDAGKFVGSIYLTHQNEIGIAIKKDYIGHGYGHASVTNIMDMFPDTPLYANINPANHMSIRMFDRLGFTHIQNTYRLR